MRIFQVMLHGNDILKQQAVRLDICVYKMEDRIAYSKPKYSDNIGTKLEVTVPSNNYKSIL